MMAGTRTRKCTNRVVLLKLNNYVIENKNAFNGKTFPAIIALVEANFPGEYFSPETIRDVMKANDIVIGRIKNLSGDERFKRDRARYVAKLLKKVVDRLSSDLGVSLLEDDDYKDLKMIIDGQTPEST